MARPSYLFVMLHDLLLCLSDDALQLMETFLHIGKPCPGQLLLAPDAFQKFLSLLLGDARALLPLLDTLRKDLIDPADGGEEEEEKKKHKVM